MSVEINHERCMHCGGCVGTCPQNSLFLKEFILEVDESCNECGICVKMCPTKSLEIRGD
ncbi:MAG: 4Fe-4S binding protein [Thermoplasmata archaeon]